MKKVEAHAEAIYPSTTSLARASLFILRQLSPTKINSSPSECQVLREATPGMALLPFTSHQVSSTLLPHAGSRVPTSPALIILRLDLHEFYRCFPTLRKSGAIALLPVHSSGLLPKWEARYRQLSC